MRSQITEGAKTSGRNTWSVFLTRWKDTVTTVGGIVTILSAVVATVLGATWFVDRKVEAVRGELARVINTTNAELAALRNQIGAGDERTETRTTTLNDNIGENGERIARMEAALAGTSGWLDRLHTKVAKNAEAITELQVRGTPD